MKSLWDEKNEYHFAIGYFVASNLTLESAIKEALYDTELAVLCARTFGEDEGEWINDEVQTQSKINSFLLKITRSNLKDLASIKFDFYDDMSARIKKHHAKKITEDITESYNRDDAECRKPLDLHFDAGVKPSDFMGDTL